MMARVIRFAKTIRNNWKKSVAAAGALVYGGNYAKGKYATEQLMQMYCKEALQYGETPLPVGSKPQHITVLLNPAANKGKGKVMFERYCAPLLYLAGLKVSVVRTEHEGQAKSLMEIMDNTEAVVIAGGDGTLSEAVTGLLRRDDSSIAVNRFPIGILPLGKTNTVAQSLFLNPSYSEVKYMAEATMAVIKQVLRPVDVMKIEALETEKELPGKPVYAVSSLDWGAFRDAYHRREKYWYWGFLKCYATYIFSAFKNLMWNCQAELQYTLPCDGCSKCYIPVLEIPKPAQRWWHMFLPMKNRAVEVKQVTDYSKIENPDCGVWRKKDISTVDFHVTTENISQNCKRDGVKHLEVTIGPKTVKIVDFIYEGWQREKGRSNLESEKLRVKELRLLPKTKEEKNVERWYSIDSEDFEVKPFHVTLLPRRIYMYCSPESVV